MNLSLARIRSLFPNFNERRLTAEDFWRVVDSDPKLRAKTMPLMVDGYYTTKKGKHYILINNKLSGLLWLHTAFHELHHYLFDVPSEKDNYAFYRNGEYEDRREYRADAFALCCILPWPELLELTSEDLENFPELGPLVRDRIAVRTHFGI